MRNLKINPIYVVLGVLTLVAFKSPSNQQVINSNERVITVTGSADMLIPPDEISLDITYREYWYSRYHKSKKDISKIEEGIVKSINEAGIPSESISINEANVWKYGWNYWSHWYNYYDYGRMIQKSLTVKLASAKDLNKIIKNLKNKSIRKEGIVNIQLNGSSNKKIQEYRKMVKERAIQAAQEKADYLLDAVGQKRGMVVTIQELNDPKRSKTTTHHGYPHGYDPYFGWYGGYGGSTTISNGGMNAVSNSSVSMPSRGSGVVTSNKKDDLSMKPIKLRYEIQAQFTIVSM